MIAVGQHRNQYDLVGFTMIRQYVPPAIARGWGERALANAQDERDLTPNARRVGDYWQRVSGSRDS